MAVFSVAGSSQMRIPVAKLERALEAKDLKLQTLTSLATKNDTLRTVVCRP